MKKLFYLITISLVLTLFACSNAEKNSLFMPSMSAQIDSTKWFADYKFIKVKGGQMVFEASDAPGMNIGRTLTMTVYGNYLGSYAQNFDARTKVSTTQCRMVYKKIDKLGSGNTEFIENNNSYEGFVRITEINTQERFISGFFTFKVRANLATPSINIINGEFTNVPYSE